MRRLYIKKIQGLHKEYGRQILAQWNQGKQKELINYIFIRIVIILVLILGILFMIKRG